MRPIAKSLLKTLDLKSTIFEHRIGFLRRFCLSTPSVNHTINDFCGKATLPRGTHDISTLNTGETFVKLLRKTLSLSLHKSSHGNFDSYIQSFIQDPGCKPTVEKDT